MFRAMRMTRLLQQYDWAATYVSRYRTTQECTGVGWPRTRRVDLVQKLFIYDMSAKLILDPRIL